MSTKLFRGVVNELSFRDNTLCVSENVVTTIRHFVDGRRTGNVTLSFRGGDLRIIKVEETATAK